MSRLVIAFLSKSKGLLILWLQLPSTVILEPPKIKPDTVSIVSPSICHEVMGPDAILQLKKKKKERKKKKKKKERKINPKLLAG